MSVSDAFAYIRGKLSRNPFGVHGKLMQSFLKVPQVFDTNFPQSTGEAAAELF